jgi:hypothetical protein
MAGILASAAAPAVIASGVLMPVRRVWRPAPNFLASDILDALHRASRGLYDGVDDVIYLEPVGMRMNGGRVWQDAAGTIPVTAPGQPVGRVDHHMLTPRGWVASTATSAANRPSFGIDPVHGGYIEFHGSSDPRGPSELVMNSGLWRA